MEMDKENLQSQILGRKLLLDSSTVTRTPLHAVNQQTAKHTPLPLCVKKLVHAQCKTEENKRHSWAPETGASLKSSGALIGNVEHNTPTRTSKYSDRLQKRISLMKIAKSRLERAEVASPAGCLVPESPTAVSRRGPCQPAIKSASYPLVTSVLKRHEPEILSRVDDHQDSPSLQEATVPSPGCVHSTQNSKAASFQDQVVEELEQSSERQSFTDACSIHVEQSTDHALEAVSSIIDALLRAVERKADVPLTNLPASKISKESDQLNEAVSSADSLNSCHDGGEWNKMDWQGIMLQLPPPDLLSPYTNEYCRFLASYSRNTNEIHSETPIEEPILNAFSSEKEHSCISESPPKRNLWDRNAKRQGDFRSPEDMNSKTCKREVDSLELTVLKAYPSFESIYTGYGFAESGNIAKESEDMVQSSAESDGSANASVCLDMQELAEKMTRSTELLSVNVTSQVAVCAASTSLSCGECNEEKRVFLVERSSLSLPERTAAEIELSEPSSEHIQLPSADPRNIFETALICPNLESQGVPGLPEKGDADTPITKDQINIDDAMVMAQAEDTATTADNAEIMGKDNCLIAVSEREIDTTYKSIASKDVALSPVRIPGLEVDTMTTSVGTVDVGLETETMESVDQSMLATTDTQHQTTMTDNTGCLSVYTSMTPFKLLRKQGQRLTSNDIRKQHPRALANQLETLAVCNARLEMELQLADRERTRLRAAVKEMKAALASKEEEKMEIEDKKLNEWKEKENQLTEKIKALEQEVEARQKYTEEIEAEVLILRQAGASLGRLHEEEVSELQDKCHSLEEQALKAADQHENEVSELKAASEASSYERQFRCAMHMVREHEAEVEELRSLFGDLEEAVHRQEKVTKAFEEVHKKVKLFAKEHVYLRTQLAQQGKCRKQEETAGQVEEEKQLLLKETQNWRQMVELNQGNMAELEKLYCVASSDLLTATSQLVKLNSELLGTRKALQDLLLSKDALAQEAIVLQDKLTAAQHDNAVMTETLSRTQMELHKRARACEELRHISKNLNQEYEDKLENMVLGIENLQHTLDNREVDIDNLEKDLYECRNIIVEQRYKIDALEKDLLDARGLAVLEDKDNIEFLKESNQYLEAERTLYVSSLRDLEEKLRVASLEARCQQQVAADAEKLVMQLEHEKLGLISEAKSLRQQLGKTSHALALADAEHSKMESYTVAAASDLLQQMQAMLNELKKKIGLQEKPGTLRAAKQDLAHASLSNASKPKHCYDRSFVSTILDAILEPQDCGDSEIAGEEGRLAALERKEHCRHASDRTANNSDMAAVMNASGDASSTGAGAFSSLEAVSPDKTEEEEDEEEMVDIQHQNPIFQSLGLTASDLAFVGTNTVSKASKTKAHEGSKNMSSRPDENRAHNTTSNLVPFQPSAFTPVHLSSSSVHGFSIVAPSSAPLSSAFARIRTIPRASSHTSANRRSFQEDSKNMADKKQSGIVACIGTMEEVFTEIIHLGSILERASQLSLQDLKAENDMLRERTDILEKGLNLSHRQLETSHQETAAMETTVQQLKDRMHQMTEHIMSLTDKKFEVKRLTAEVRHLQKQADSERQEKEVIARELESLLKYVETSSGAVDEGFVQAKCMRDMVALKKKNQQLLAQLGEQQDHYEEMGSKAARRMQILEDNWRKAEDEVYRFDELVESIRQTIQVAVEKGCSYPELVCILELIEGENKESVL